MLSLITELMCLRCVLAVTEKITRPSCQAIVTQSQLSINLDGKRAKKKKNRTNFLSDMTETGHH